MIKTQTSFVQMYQHSHIFSVKEELNASDRQLNSAVIPGSTYCVSHSVTANDSHSVKRPDSV